MGSAPAEGILTMEQSHLGLGIVPSAWRVMVTSPVPKCTPVSGINDLRPISVTPILSRFVYSLIVRDHIFPASNIIDQYGLKPTGSTVAAVVDLTNRISVMLEVNKNVRCLLIDFSKAFDSVDHLTLIAKAKDLNFAEDIIQSFDAFLTDKN